jgi:hypothetical protein
VSKLLFFVFCVPPPFTHKCGLFCYFLLGARQLNGGCKGARIEKSGGAALAAISN